MRIAFDLDDTLIPKLHSFPTEPAPFGLLSWWFCREPLRLGTKELLRGLRRQGHELWIYTSSLRSPFSVKWLFRQYGIGIAGIVNQDRHDQVIGRMDQTFRSLCKYPPAFGIDLLVDDSEGVFLESFRHGFPVILVEPGDENWFMTVIDGIAKMQRQGRLSA